MRWPGGGPRIDLDQPIPGAEVGATVEVAGWAFSRRGPIARVEAQPGGAASIPLAHGRPRPDVAAAHGCEVACGFAGQVPLNGIPAGPVVLRVTAVDATGRRAVCRVTVVRDRGTVRPPEARLDVPGPGPAPPRMPAVLAPPAPAAATELGALLATFRDELERDPTVLDLTGLSLAATLPGELVVTPLDAATLPYADQSFDVVAVARDDSARREQARRLATRAVVLVPPEGGHRILWGGGGPATRFPRVSVVIPVFNQSACTRACLRAVLDTWPASLEGEVLVVDDGSTDDTADMVARAAERDPRVRLLRQGENRGFVAACNAGAAAASGDVLIFLNNDTLPRPGWLPPLLATLRRERAGAVGGKLLYPDGTLQEAGGVIFSDGDGCNFGKGEAAPDHPLFDHVREVDYCSGALLATPRELFLRLGGFDPVYAPAYYEDADYAFRLRREGLRVYYQPASAVVHLEGATAGRDVHTGVKRHQAHNRTTFAARWGEALADQPPHPPAIDRRVLHRLHARGRRTRRVLVVLPTIPELDRESGSRRAYHLVELLLGEGWAVSVVVERAAGGERYARALRQLGAAAYTGSTMGTALDGGPDLSELLAVEEFDFALLAFWHLAERHLQALRTLSPRTRVIVDSVDLHFLRQARGAFARSRSHRGAPPLDGRFADELRRELNVYGLADGVLTVSEKEAGWIDDLLGETGRALCVPDLEDSPGPPPPVESRRGLLFVGNFRHPPNVEALGFLHEVVTRLDPAVLAAHPLAIVGNALEADLLGPLARHAHVHAVGWVPSLAPYLERARMSLAPLRHGAGTKRKLLQSLLHGTPCVSTPVGVEGLDLEPGREVLVAVTADDFASAITRLAAADETWRRLSAEGRAAIERAHGRETVRGRLKAALETVLGRPPR